MKIYFFFNKKLYTLKVSEDETIHNIKERIKDKLGESRYIQLMFNSVILEDKYKISDYRIKHKDWLYIIIPYKGGFDNIKKDIDLNIGFDVNLIKRDELYINLIHFDAAMTNSENYGYFNIFKVDVVGGFYAIDNLDILNDYLQQADYKNIPFILITSGSNGKDVIPICKKYSIVKEVIIFCRNYEYNKHYIDDYPGYVNKVLTSISSVYDYIKSFGANKFKDGTEKFKFSQDEIKMDRQVQFCPVITSSEYDKCYFLIHRALAHFFGNINYDNPTFFPSNLKRVKESLNKAKDIDSYDRNNLLNIFEKFLGITDNNTFVEKSIRYYTSESKFCY